MDDPGGYFPDGYFSPTYAIARRRFLDAAEAAGLQPVAHRHPLRGVEGEELALDVAVDGDPNAANRLIVSSGCHGVEGHAGSGLQLFALSDNSLREEARQAGVTIIHLHALNPFGFSHLRRTTQENVDLNRNFLDFSRPLPINEAYRRVHPLLVPEQWPPSEANGGTLLEMMESEGARALQAAVSRGQHEYADGLFFGGFEPCWSNLTLRQVLRHTAATAKRLAWIDLHTGLGPPGVAEPILACDSGPAQARAKAWWGPGVTSMGDETSVSAFLTGLMWTAARDECPHAEYTGIALEYGTVPLPDVLQALRAANWLHNNQRDDRPGPPDDLVRRIRRQTLDAFYIDNQAWKAQVLSQGREAISQAIAGLSTAATAD